jgi:hypothetical protein
MKCPRCEYERQSTDEAPSWQCPRCKVAYVKAERGRTPEATAPAATMPVESQTPRVKSEPAKVEAEDDGSLVLAANGLRIVIQAMVLILVLHAVRRFGVIPSWSVDICFIAVAVYSLRGILRICSGLGQHRNRKLLCMVLTFFPLINLVVLVILSLTATEKLRAAGWRVNLLGAKP